MTVPYHEARPRRWYHPLFIAILGLIATGLLAVFLGLRTLDRVIPLPVVYDPRAQLAPFFLRPAEPSQLLTASLERAGRRPPAGTRLVGRSFQEFAWERLPPASAPIAAVEAQRVCLDSPVSALDSLLDDDPTLRAAVDVVIRTVDGDLSQLRVRLRTIGRLAPWSPWQVDVYSEDWQLVGVEWLPAGPPEPLPPGSSHCP